MKLLASSTLSMIVAAGLLFAVQVQLDRLPDSNVVFCEALWILIFSLTARAALSISYDDRDFDPMHGRMMSLIGLLYCFLVDK